MNLPKFVVLGILALAACATVPPAPVKSEGDATRQQQVQAQAAVAAVPDVKRLKRKIAIARFTNETRYGRTFLRSTDTDPLGKQASDMLAARLVESGAFLVFERTDLDKIKREQEITGQSDIIGVDTLILGSVTEFGRSTVGQSGFLSATKRQVAHAKVEIRLTDPRTGQAFFSATGAGEATSEAGEVFGFGSAADYDGTLNDKAIGAAVSDVLNSLVAKLQERPWHTDILKVQGHQVFISGGARQGIKVGDVLSIMRPGETIKSGQTGFSIPLPPTEIGAIRVISLFGDSDADEGSVAEIISGSLGGGPTQNLIVMESKEAKS